MQVAQQGEAILALTASEVTADEYQSAWLRAVIEAMQDTMLQRQGVGIAAPQVYWSKRVIIVASKPNARYPDAPYMQPIVMLNPEILQASAAQLLGEEGCLSVPAQRGKVARSAEITVRYIDLEGTTHTQQFSGFPARIVQHEIDHLNGILFVERL